MATLLSPFMPVLISEMGLTILGVFLIQQYSFEKIIEEEMSVRSQASSKATTLKYS